MIPFKFNGCEIYLTPDQILKQMSNNNPSSLFRLEIALYNNVIECRKKMNKIVTALATLGDWYDYQNNNEERPDLVLIEHNGYEVRVDDMSLDEVKSRIRIETQRYTSYEAKYKLNVLQIQELVPYLDENFPKRPKYHCPTRERNFINEAISTPIKTQI